VVKVIWDKAASLLQTDYSPGLDHVLPSDHPTPQPKREIDRFSHFCTARGRMSSAMSFPVIIARLQGGFGPHLIRASLGPPEFINSISIGSAVFAQFTSERRWACGHALPLKIVRSHGDLKQCENYRTIALVSHASKILLWIILERIRVKTETEIADEQAGFRQGRGTRDQITNLRILMHKAREHQQQLYMCFVDFRKAFDSMFHDKLCVKIRN